MSAFTWNMHVHQLCDINGVHMSDLTNCVMCMCCNVMCCEALQTHTHIQFKYTRVLCVVCAQYSPWFVNMQRHYVWIWFKHVIHSLNSHTLHVYHVCMHNWNNDWYTQQRICGWVQSNHHTQVNVHQETCVRMHTHMLMWIYVNWFNVHRNSTQSHHV